MRWFFRVIYSSIKGVPTPWGFNSDHLRASFHFYIFWSKPIFFNTKSYKYIVKRIIYPDFTPFSAQPQQRWEYWIISGIFVFSVGKLHKIEVWHDHSGDDPEWFLERIVVKNMVDGEKFFFFCNKWVVFMILQEITFKNVARYFIFFKDRDLS